MKIGNSRQFETIPGYPVWSITRQLTWLYALSTTIMLIFASGFLYWVLLTTLEEEDQQFINSRMEVLNHILNAGNKEALEEEIAHEDVGATNSEYNHVFIRVLNDSGLTLYEAAGMDQEVPSAVFPDPIESNGKAIKWHSPGNKSYLLAAKAGDAATGGPGWRIQIALHETDEDLLVSRYERYLISVLLIGVLMSATIGIAIAEHGMRPLANITKAAERITASHLSDRIDAAQWPKELVSLARAFDDMLGRLEDSFGRLSQFSADLAHELRTPINNLRGEAEVALSKPRTEYDYREILASSLEEYARLSRMMESLLFLAKAENAQEIVTRATVDVRTEVTKVIAFYEALAAEHDVRVVCEGDGSVDVDPILFQRAISNLLSNALNHTPPGGNISFSIRRDGDGIEVICNDSGSGIAQEHLPKIFDRFYQVDPSRTKTEHAGLGLAIVKSIVGLHSGKLAVKSTVGQGTSIRLFFPA